MKKINILTIDGGGSKGVIAIEQLIMFEKLLGHGQTLLSKFDMFSGTSTGGIIAVMLSIGYSANDIKELYLKHGNKIFDKGFLRFGIFKSKYNDSYFNKVLEDYLSNKTLKDCKNMCMIPSYNTTTMDTVIFKSMNHHKDNFRLFDVVRSTTSAPTYFDSHSINSQSYIDGGLSINNPSMASFVEALKMGYEEINILSIDTGRMENPIDGKQLKKGIAGNAQSLFNIALNEQAQTVDYYMKNIYESIFNRRGSYVRVESRIFESSGEIDDFSEKNMKDMVYDGWQSFKLNEAKFIDFVSKM